MDKTSRAANEERRCRFNVLARKSAIARVGLQHLRESVDQPFMDTATSARMSNKAFRCQAAQLRQEVDTQTSMVRRKACIL